MTVRMSIFSCFLACLLISGCATKPPFRVHPQFDEKLRATRKVIVMPPKIDVYQITAGGVKEKIDEWTKEASKNVMAAIEDQLKSKSRCIFQDLPRHSLSKEAEFDFEDTQALFDSVCLSIIAHTYGSQEQLFSEKIKNFDYSLGPEIKDLGQQADALLFVRGVDHISTGGRKALQATTVVMLALLGGVAVPQGGFTAISIALVDNNTGSILWYNFTGSAGGHDLRDPTSAAVLVKELLKDFPNL